MLHRKIYQICSEGREVSVFLRDQQRWIEDAKIVDLEGDVVTIRYETEDEEEISAWEEIVRLESIGTITQKIASVSRTTSEISVTEDCHETEKLPVIQDLTETGDRRSHSSSHSSDIASGEDTTPENTESSSPSSTAKPVDPNSPDTGEQ